MGIMGRTERPAVPPAPELASSIASAVLEDERPRLTGSLEGDAVAMARWSFDESRWGWRRVRGKWEHWCPSGDGGKSWGDFQIKEAISRACDTAAAPRDWLVKAHASVTDCGDLTGLASGTCGVATRLVKWRMAGAARVAAQMSQ